MSVALLLSALVVDTTGWLSLDAVTAIGVGTTVIWSAWGLSTSRTALTAPVVIDRAAGISLHQSGAAADSGGGAPGRRRSTLQLEIRQELDSSLNRFPNKTKGETGDEPEANLPQR